MKPGKVMVIPEHRFVSTNKPHLMNERIRQMMGLEKSEKKWFDPYLNPK